jgi:hypothetical protein
MKILHPCACRKRDRREKSRQARQLKAARQFRWN